MNDNDKALQAKVNSAMYTTIKQKGYAATVDVLMAIGVLSKADYENWRNGKVDYLERVCKVNLRKLSFINHEIRVYAGKHNLKPSFTVYKRWNVKKASGQGRKPVIRLRFSKSGDEQIERLYATHYVSQDALAKSKEQKA